MLDRSRVISLSAAVAALLANGDTEFYPAFDVAFASSNFNPEDKREVQKEVGKILNWRKQKKKMAQSYTVSQEAQPARKPIAKQESLGLNRSRYPD